MTTVIVFVLAPHAFWAAATKPSGRSSVVRIPCLPRHKSYASVGINSTVTGGASSSGDLPPTRFEPIVNLKRAKALGLTIPPSVPVRADQVIA